jgi:coenzyme F420-0:L-glutamate ligase
VELYPLRSSLIRPGDSIVSKFSEALSQRNVRLRSADVVAVASKVVAIAQSRLRPLSQVRPSRRAIRLGRRYSLPPDFVQVVIDEADLVYGGVKGALLTLKNGEATANAGVDQKNAPKGFVVLWPANPDISARKIRVSLSRTFRRKIGVVVVDSRVAPLRLGTVGLALGSSGIEAIRDFRGKPDLYGRQARITFHAIADDIASAAHLVMGEGRERTPFVVVRGAPVRLTGNHGRKTRLSVEECLYMSQVSRRTRRRS